MHRAINQMTNMSLLCPDRNTVIRRVGLCADAIALHGKPFTRHRCNLHAWESVFEENTLEPEVQYWVTVLNSYIMHFSLSLGLVWTVCVTYSYPVSSNQLSDGRVGYCAQILIVSQDMWVRQNLDGKDELYIYIWHWNKSILLESARHI